MRDALRCLVGRGGIALAALHRPPLYDRRLAGRLYEVGVVERAGTKERTLLQDNRYAGRGAGVVVGGTR